MSPGPRPQPVDRLIALLLLAPTDGPRWVLSELAPSDGRRIEVAGDPIPLPADVDGDGANELLLADPPGLWFAGRLRVVSSITGRTLVEHATPLDWGRHFDTLPLPDLDHAGEPETALSFRPSRESKVATVVLLDGEDGRLRFLMASPPGHECLGWEVRSERDLDGDCVDELRLTTRRVPSERDEPVAHWTEWIVSPAYGALLDRREHERGLDDGPLFGALSWTLDADLDGIADEWRREPPGPELALYSGRTSERLLVRERAEYWNLSSTGGTSIEPAGDVDGDGVQDWIQGDSAHNRELGPESGWFEDAGCVEIYSGRTGRILLSIQGPERCDCWGKGVGAAGDVDGDGIDDVFVMACQTAWVLYGRRAGAWY